jgi:hypothetical protein
MKNFHKGIDRETWKLINQVTKQSDKVVAEAIKQLKAKAKPSTK